MATASAFFLPMFMRAPQYRLEFFFNSLSPRSVQFERQKLLLNHIEAQSRYCIQCLWQAFLPVKVVAPPEYFLHYFYDAARAKLGAGYPSGPCWQPRQRHTE